MSPPQLFATSWTDIVLRNITVPYPPTCFITPPPHSDRLVTIYGTDAYLFRVHHPKESHLTLTDIKFVT